jgi:hypothetical protein
MIYIPLRYTLSAKYPTLWFIDQLVFVDMLMAIAATSYSTKTLLVHCLCIPFYVLSLMCVYEIGYFDNDMNAAKSEIAPAISDRMHRFAGYAIEPYSWIVALLLAGAAGLLATQSLLLTVDMLWIRSAAWIGVLIGIRVTFYVYNRQKESRRPILYFVLQVLKYCGVLVMFPPTIFGVAITAAQIIAISVVYLTYRMADRHTSESINREKMRLAFACGIGIPLFLAGARTAVDSLMAAALAAAWLLLRLAKPTVKSVLESRAVLS